MNYSVYLSSYDTGDPPRVDEVADWMKRDARTMLEDLKG